MSDIILKNLVKNYGGKFLAVNDLSTTFKAGSGINARNPERTKIAATVASVTVAIL